MRKTRVLVAKVGLDLHNRGLMLVSSLLRDAGLEVIYAGQLLTPDAIAKLALEEDADAIGLSFLNYEWEYYLPLIMEKLKSQGMSDTAVIVGGLIPEDKNPYLKELGVHAVFGLGSKGDDIIKVIQGISPRREK